MLWLRDFFVSFLFLAVAPKLAEADGQISSWNANVHAATEVDPPTSPASPSDPEAVSTEKSRPSQISEKSLDVPEEEPKAARGQSAARDAFLFPGESADLSFASGSLSYIECEEASGAGHIPQSADPSTLPLSSPPSTPSFLSFHQPNSSRETRLSLPVFPPRLACAAKKVPSAEVGKEVLSAAAACSAAFAARRASDWEKVEAFNKKLAGLGLAEGPQRLAPLTHVVPTGVGAPVTRRSSFLYWAKSCLFPGVGGDVCFAAVWCTDGIRTASELAIDTTGDIRLLIGERVVLLAGVTGVFSRCEDGGLCQKAKFVGQVEKTAGGDPDDSRAAWSVRQRPRRAFPSGERKRGELSGTQHRLAKQTNELLSESSGKSRATEPQQMPEIPLWSLDCTREFLDLNSGAAVYTIDGESYVKMGWTTDRRATVYCETSASTPRFQLLPLATLAVHLVVSMLRRFRETLETPSAV